MKKIDQVSIRQQNILRIFEILCDKSPITRQEAAEGTGLSLMSVSNLVEQLTRLEVLSFTVAPPKECAGERRSAGRKAELISLNQTRHTWLIFDLTDEFFRLTAFSLGLTTLLSISAYSGDLQGDYLHNLKSFLREAREKTAALLKNRQILGVAIVAPGPYDISGDTITNQRLPALNSIHIKELFHEVFGAYDYYVDEDVKFAVRAFLPLCAKEAAEVLFYLYVGEGVGGAAIHSENVLRGQNAAAGDVGQLRTGGHTYESLLSLRVFAAACGLDYRPAISEEALLANIRQFAQASSKKYQCVLMENARIVGKMLMAVVWMLDPMVIMIDCAYAQPMQAAFLAAVDDSLAQALSSAHLKRPRLELVSGKMNSVAFGAAKVLCREWVERVT